MAEPGTGKYLIENCGCGHTNRKSFDLVSAEILDEKGLANPEAMIAGSRFPRSTSPSCSPAWSRCTKR